MFSFYCQSTFYFHFLVWYNEFPLAPKTCPPAWFGWFSTVFQPWAYVSFLTLQRFGLEVEDDEITFPWACCMWDTCGGRRAWCCCKACTEPIGRRCCVIYKEQENDGLFLKREFLYVLKHQKINISISIKAKTIEAAISLFYDSLFAFTGADRRKSLPNTIFYKKFSYFT